MRHLTLAVLCVCASFAQSITAQGPTAAPAISTPAVPTGFATFLEFNQLGTTSKWSGGLSAIYPASTSMGVYLTTTGDILPKKAVDPTTGLSFYAISASLRQGVHKSMLSTGKFTFLLGGDVGPSFSQPNGTLSVSFSSSFIATGLYQVNNVFSVIVPVRMLYISGIGWNPVLEAGVAINTKNLPKASARNHGAPTLAQMRAVMRRCGLPESEIK
jgi:hypothetical protein